MGLDLAHYIPVKSSENFDGYELVSQDDLDDPAFFACVKDVIEDQGQGTWYLYYRELGQQRKGMGDMFYERFKPGYYTDKHSVEEAFKYLQGDHLTSLNDLRASFRDTFLDNFDEGKSVFFVSY